jgi:hypothetical protein
MGHSVVWQVCKSWRSTWQLQARSAHQLRRGVREKGTHTKLSHGTQLGLEHARPQHKGCDTHDDQQWGLCELTSAVSATTTPDTMWRW